MTGGGVLAYLTEFEAGPYNWARSVLNRSIERDNQPSG